MRELQRTRFLMTRFGFQVGDLVVEVEGTGPFRGRERFAPRAEPDLVLQASYCAEPLRPAGVATIECDTWAAFTSGKDVSLVSQLRHWSPPEFARIDVTKGSRTGTLLMRPGLTQDPLDYPLDQLLTIHLLHQRGGMLLHAACLMHRGRTFVVAGPSGAGKTTLARAAAALPGVTVLTDERVVVRLHEGRWFADGTPWVGEGSFAHPASGPLAGIFILDKSNVDRVERLSPVRAMAALLGCHFPAAWSASDEDQLKPLEELVAAVPAYRLQTRLGGVAHRLVVGGGQSDPGCLGAERGRGALIAELLRGGGSAEFTAFGSSMTPAICPGDKITVAPCDASRAEVGDVVIFERQSQLVAHRVISLIPLTTQGDALTLPDANIEPTALLGRVARVRRKARSRLRWSVKRLLRATVGRLRLLELFQPDTIS
jgi:hypothetical protein